MVFESPWEENPQAEYAPEANWTKISTEFTNSGYREGIIAGKETSLQEGFDAGFADVGVPIGRELGNLRGAVSTIVSFLRSHSPAKSPELDEAHNISSILISVRLSDITPHDLEAEQHAREHLGSDDPGLAENEELVQKRDMEGLEDMLAQLTAGVASAPGAPPQARPTKEDVAKLKQRLRALGAKLGLAPLT
ncbi:hypothetical protein PAXRUDRAFT_834464 [Paxillus rubicundulus Ve08.2h10]|uniref:Protein YAE1 n=1 Tax=Paxillus rubicundulus Ve08.2h10 TaxID=930991 RepID=A0A0D0D529_9AGAM|nr:hypothetical protein PAXRUDRAFT_834464 [Paxillus rubicundulus Ve08.2h10]